MSLTFLLMFFLFICDSVSLYETLSPSLSLKVTDSSVSRTDGTAGCMIGAQNLKELQTHIILTGELGQKAAELPKQVRSHRIFRETFDLHYTDRAVASNKAISQNCKVEGLWESEDKSESCCFDV